MTTSILNSIKEYIGLTECYSPFDSDLIMLINSEFSVLRQLGCGPDDGFSITGASTDWSEYLEDEPILGMVKEYIFLRAKVVFDPPQSSSVLEAYNKRIDELTWRINTEIDTRIFKEEQQLEKDKN